MQSISKHNVHLTSTASLTTPQAKTATPADSGTRLLLQSYNLDKDVRAIATNLAKMLCAPNSSAALHECLKACCELIDLIAEQDGSDPESDNIHQKLDEATRGLSCLLTKNQQVLEKEKTLNELIKFAKELGSAAKGSQPKPHPKSMKFNAALSQQDRDSKWVEDIKKNLELKLDSKWDANNFPKSDTKQIETAKKLLTNSLILIEDSISLNMAPRCFGDDAKIQLKSISDMVIDLNQSIDLLEKIPDLAIRENSKVRSNFISLHEEQLAGLNAKKAVLENYLSPVGTSKILSAKAQCVAAAKAVLKNELKNLKAEHNKAGKQALENMETRIKALNNPSTKKLVFNTKLLYGQKKLSFFQQLLHPLRAGRQENILNARAIEFTTKKSESNKTIGVTRYFTETMFMQAVLEETLKPLGYSSATIKKLLQEQISEGHNSRDWVEIKSSFQVPLHSPQGAQIMVPVTTLTKPAGNALTDQATFRIVSTGSPVTQKTVDQFRGKGFRNADQTIPTIRGVNSHCATETQHCTSLATCELSIDGEVAFTATRHGVCSAYDLNPAYIQALPTPEREAVMQVLSTGVSNQATQLIIGKPATPADAKNLTALPETELQQNIKAELIKLGIADDQLETTLKNPAELAKLALKSPALCLLVKRVANLNRAREAFITELNHNKKLQAKLNKQEKISFNSISLLTPDQLRATKNQITGQQNSENEKQMLIEQVQAWKDLQHEIDSGGVTVNGTAIQAKIRSFNFGVNKGAVELSSNPVMGELVSGCEYADEQNAIGMQDLFGDPLDPTNMGEVSENLKAKSADLRQKKQSLSKLLQVIPIDTEAIHTLDNEIKALAADIHIIKQLSDQIKAMWEDKSYRQGDAEPYKMVTRLALLSYLLDGGTLFNCKSGKDRTGELDIEVKFLAFQIHTNGGTVPTPNRQRIHLDKAQLAVFMFEDESRRTMQEYNTGYGGSKLRGAWALYDSFTPTPENSDSAIREFLGSSSNAGS